MKQRYSKHLHSHITKARNAGFTQALSFYLDGALTLSDVSGHIYYPYGLIKVDACPICKATISWVSAGNGIKGTVIELWDNTRIN